LNEGVSVNSIAKAFCHFGEICSVEFDGENSPLVFMEFKCPESASECVRTWTPLLNFCYRPVLNDVKLSVMFTFNKEAATLCRGSFNESTLKEHFSFDELGTGSDIVGVDLPWSDEGGYAGVLFRCCLNLCCLRHWRSDIQTTSIRKKSFLLFLLLLTHIMYVCMYVCLPGRVCGWLVV
jgi:hypothetical protein